GMVSSQGLVDLGLVRSEAGTGELQDDRVMHEAVDGGRGGHGILEDAVPLAENEVRGDDDGPPLIALCEKGEQDLDLVGRLLDVANVVEDDHVEEVEPTECPGQAEVAL